MKTILCGKVLKVINAYKLVINKGSDDGVTMGDRFLIYRLGDEIVDPDTKKYLGTLELVCGEGKPEHIQERFTTIVSDKKIMDKSKKIIRTNGLSPFYSTTEETSDPKEIQVPFDSPDTDCLFKQIN